MRCGGCGTYSNKDRKDRWSLSTVVEEFEVKNQNNNDDEHEDDSSYDEALFVHSGDIRINDTS